MSDFKRFCEIRESLIKAGMCEIEAHQFAHNRMMEMSIHLNTPDVDDSDFNNNNNNDNDNEEDQDD